MAKGILYTVGMVVALVVGLFAGYNALPESLGSVVQGGEYFSTSTGGNLIPVPQQLLVTGPGALGSVVITGAGAGVMNFYNATTTSVLARTGRKPTSTIWIASIPASAAAGTYTFDANFYDGLLMELETVEPTSTVTWHIF